MSRFQLNPWGRTACAVVSVALAIGLRLALDPVLGDHFTYAIVLFAVLVSAWYGGFGTAMLAAVLGGFGVRYFFLAPRGSFVVDGPKQDMALWLYMFTAVGIAMLAGSMHAARRRAEAAAEALRRQAALIDLTNESLEARVRARTLELHMERDFLAHIVSTVPVVICQLRRRADGTMCVPFASPAMEDLFGVPADALKDDASLALSRIQANDIDRILVELDESARGMTPWLFEFRVASPVLGDISVEGYAIPTAEPNGEVQWHGYMADVTDRRKADAALRDRERLLRIVTESARVGMVVVDAGYRYLFANEAYGEIFGLNSREIVGRPVSEGRASAWPQIQPRLDRALAGERVAYELCLPPTADSQATRHFSVTYEPVRTEDGERTVVVVSTDITARNAALLAVEQSEARLRLAQQVGRIGTFDWDARRDVNIWTPELEALYGLEPGGYPRTRADFDALIHPDDRASAAEAVGRAFATGLPTDAEWRTVWPDGTTHWITCRFQGFLDENGEPLRLTGINADHTERRQESEARKTLETQLQQSQKMEAFGQLAGGVAHDFNNLLTVINAYSTMVATSMAPDSDSAAMMTEIRKAGERAASLTRQMLAFSRQQVLEAKVLNINDVVIDVEKMLSRLIGEDVLLATVLSPTIGSVRVDPGQMEQVLMNLAVNARDAMPQGGRLTIETSEVEFDESYVQSHREVTPGKYVMVAMTDTGAGMTREVQARLFEPFFTTKGVGKGTGLGLAVAHGIVKQSGGSIGVYSEPGVGTTFKVYLPAVFEEQDVVATHRPARSPRGTETSLLVEDEAGVRDVATRVLQRYGYTVLTAPTGSAAIELMASAAPSVDLVVTDVVMPEMSGRSLAATLSTMRPELKVLFMSGYTDDAVVRHGVLQADVAFLQKPFTPSSLGNRVREVLDA